MSDTEALHRIDSHEKVCTERYGNIDHSLNELKAMVLAQGSDVHQRLNTISNRMWAAVVGALSMTVLGLAAVCFYLMTKAGHI